MKNKIFISIAAYEEVDLVKTIKNCLENSKNPENLFFGISLQYENEPNLDFVKDQSSVIRFEHDIRSKKSPGIIQIRSAIRKLHTDQEYFLQIDSHTAFDIHWDAKLIEDIEVLNQKIPTIISKQIQQKEITTNSYTKWDMFPMSYNNFLVGSITEDANCNTIQPLLVNDKYFTNYYMSGNFIFAKQSWLYQMTFPDYHKIPYEEQELSLFTFCSGYRVVAPKREYQVIFAANDTKYEMPLNPKYWDFVGNDINNLSHWKRFWVVDDSETIKEVRKLLITGKNTYISLHNLPKSLEDFYKNIGLFNKYIKVKSLLYPDNDILNNINGGL
jgi:hypothetical protein